MNDNDVIRIVDKFSGYLSEMYHFGFFQPKDLKQEAIMKSLEAARNNTFENEKAAEKYLFMVVQNHFKNLLRKYRKKNEPPCLTCPFFDPDFKTSRNQCNKFEKKENCKEFINFERDYKTRQSLLQPCDIDNISEYEVVDHISNSELYEYIDIHLSPDLRSDFLRMLSGVKINIENAKLVRKSIAKILLNSDFEIESVVLEDFIGEDNG